MNIKSLLLGSAAALVAVTGARAADVIMVEPEPVEYVRVCDVYGTGFYYIPGTETCIRLSGYVRMQFNVAGDPAFNDEDDDYEFGTQVRTRLNFDVREETELGLLRAFARVQSTNNSRGTLQQNYVMDQAYIQLGGLLMGYRDTLWSNDVGGLEDGLLTDSDLVVGDFNTNQVSYTFAVGGFSAVIGLEDDGTGDFAPDVHGKLVYSGAWGGAFLSAVYDETFNFEDTDFSFGEILPTRFEDGENGAFALKGGVELSDLLVEGSTFRVEGHYAFDETSYAVIDSVGNVSSISDDATIVNLTPGSIPIFLEYAIGAGYSQDVGDFSVAIAGQYGETFGTDFFVDTTPGVPGGIELQNLEGEYYSLVGNVGYSFTNNFGALAEVQYSEVDFGGDIGSVDQTRGFLRFVRSF